MKRTKTLADWFARVPTAQVNQPPPLPHQESVEIGVATTAQPQVNLSPPREEQETVGIGSNDPATEFNQSPPEQESLRTQVGSNANADFAEEEYSKYVLDPEDIVSDPGLRKPIDELHPNVRDDARREYISLGPCRPNGHTYLRREISGRKRSFHKNWFEGRPWLEYSVTKDAAFCFYCFLFKPALRGENFGTESFTKNGFVSWKDGPKLLDDHANCKSHNKAREDYQSYKNQRQSIDLGILAVKMVQTDRHKNFPLVYRLIELALILPVATASVERAFSAMKVVKTESRNKMGDEWLNHRMVCYIERAVFASVKNENILYHFQELKSRKKKLPKLLSTSGATANEDEDEDEVAGSLDAPNLH